MMRTLAVLLVGLLPSSATKLMVLRRLGWTIAGDVSLGPCLLLRVLTASLGEGSHVGPFNVFRDLSRLELGRNARLGQWNWVSAASPQVTADERATGALVIGDDSAITSRHYMDCTGGIFIGAFTTVAGVRSTILTHQIDLAESRQGHAAVSVGDYCFIGSNVKIAPGSMITSQCLVAMGAVVAGKLSESYGLYAGVPARRVRDLDVNMEYFTRDRGYVY